MANLDNNEPMDEELAPTEEAPVADNAPPGAREAAQKLIAVAMRIVYNQKVSSSILEMIQRAPRPEIGIAQGVFMVLKQIKDAARGVPPNVIDSMARPVAMMILEMAAKAGIVEESPELLQQVLAMIQQALGAVRQRQAPQQQGPMQPQGAPMRPGMQQRPAAPAQPAMQPQGMIQRRMGG